MYCIVGCYVLSILYYFSMSYFYFDNSIIILFWVIPIVTLQKICYTLRFIININKMPLERQEKCATYHIRVRAKGFTWTAYGHTHFLLPIKQTINMIC